ncbi:hypothetical protein Lupro_02670 [Lutibacter profundi]|uniref:Site-specific DNA-methyltransferase (adenine-specific) n=1 Tax=Lutibacter profundi TaxID=1622118 RepID=A0A0X8G545_9FLAO|nr:hypothetical protein Lupro_02670 [Lutibacter profundi]
MDFKKGAITYPENKGLKINERQTCNLKSNENFVVLECVNRLLEKGYNPKHIELEPKWKVGHGASGGRADILVKDNSDKALLIIECKNAGTEFTKHWKETLENGSQLFGYAQQEGNAKFISLYASDFTDKKVVANYYLITLVDNEQYLEDNPKLLAFKDAKIREEIFNVWKHTYQKDYTTKGLFEKDIQAYNIGKKKYSVEDLSLVDSTTKQSKYHEFATILRKYNVSGRENAFDKLVNLFLCKIVDEKNNPKDLQFYWKGIAYDTPFEIQDRLQKLYKVGMDEFLKEEVTYIDNKQIDQAFWAFKNDPDATRETIKGYFKQLKFFTNNDFAFIDVHNERLFYENAQVLIDIVRLFQDTKIKSNTKNQFLGDMFENFLDGGIKQSEGQFFTPMPITRFIIQSLPLENIINDSQQPPKAIDYACGSGHFLNELASQMRPFIEATKDAQIEDYLKEIYGIEKEYRLSKVAKVSAFMYGQDNIDLTYADALAKNDKFKNNSFKILVANPPYAVKGFLSTLDQDSKDTYTLLNTIDSKAIQTNNSIECFFIERAKQLLEADGVGAIIVPSSVLSNADATYQETKSILLKYFHIVAIAEFGSGTFGKTGTNTVTLFIKRRNENPEKSKHYKNRINSWFANDTKKQKVFEDEHYIISYCQHLEYDFDDYKTLLKGIPNDNLLKTEMFDDYRNAFDNLTSTKNKKKQTNFKKLSQSKKEEELTDLFYTYLTEIEKEKLYYFTLASTNQSEVVIVKGPSDNKTSKKFLGYEWSTAKGNEGIKLYTDANGKHRTPLYDEDNRSNQDKINYYIQQAFENQNPVIPEELASFVSRSSLINMLDFKRTEFDKHISLTPKKTVRIQSKWKLVRLEDIAKDMFAGGDVPKNNFSENKTAKFNIPIFANGFENKGLYGYTDKARVVENCITISARGTLGYTEIRKEPFFPIVRLIVLIPNDLIKLEYLKSIIGLLDFTDSGAVIPQLTVPKVKPLKIPLPPKDIQEKIVKECKKIDKEKEKAEQGIGKAKTVIQKLVDDAFGKDKKDKISKLFIINSKTKNPTTKPDDTFTYVDIDAVGKGTGIISYNNKVLGKDAPSRARRIAEKGNFIISSVRPYLKGFAYIDKDVSDCVFSTGFFVLNSKDEKVILNKIMFYAFMYFEPLMQQIEAKMGKGQYPSINKTDLDNFTISVTNINDQKKIIKSIEKQETEIEKSRKIINGIAERKQKVLTKYL